MASSDTYQTLREMTGTKVEDFTDSDLDRYLERSLVQDSEGRNPDDEDYVPTYDLNRAAAKVWRVRAAGIARFAFDTQVDMTRANRHNVFENFIRMARFHEMKAIPYGDSPFQSMALIEEPGDNVSGDA